MAHVETWFRCPCGKAYDTQKEAIHCAISHVKSEQWAVGKSGKGVRIFENHAPNSTHGIYGALREAELSDFVEERKKQFAEMQDEKIIKLTKGDNQNEP